MTKNKFILTLTIVSLFITSISFAQNKTVQPPIAKKVPKKLTAHGHTRIDNYYWLRKKSNKQVVAYLEAENKYTDAMLKHTEELQEKLFQEMRARMKETDMTVPYKWKDYFYYDRYEEGSEYPLYCRKKSDMNAPEEIMLDVNQLAKGHEYYSIDGIATSTNQNILAYETDTTGEYLYNIYFKDLSTNKMFVDIIPDVTSIEWANDNKTVFYSTVNDAYRSYRIYRHELGTDIKDDALIFQEDNELFNVYVEKTKSEDYIMISSQSSSSVETWYLNAATPKGKFQVIHPRENKVQYYVYQYQDKFYLLTDYEAKNFRLMEAPVANPSKENWKEIIPHRENVLLEGLEIFKDHLVLIERENGLPRLRVTSKEDNTDYYIEYNDPIYIVELGDNYHFNTNILRYTYESLTTPLTTYDFNMDTKEKVTLKKEEVVGGYDPSDYESERIFSQADDGTMVPISLVYKKDLFKKDGSNPMYLTAYYLRYIFP